MTTKKDSSTDVQKSPVKAEAKAAVEEKVASRLLDLEEPVTSDQLNPAYAPAPVEDE